MRRLTWILTVYWTLCFILTHIPAPEVPRVSIPYVDKVVHFALFAGLGVLVRLRLASRESSTALKLAWAVIAVYAAFDELTQPLVRRDNELADWIADVIGAGVGLRFGLLSYSRRRS